VEILFLDCYLQTRVEPERTGISDEDPQSVVALIIDVYRLEILDEDFLLSSDLMSRSSY